MHYIIMTNLLRNMTAWICCCIISLASRHCCKTFFFLIYYTKPFFSSPSNPSFFVHHTLTNPHPHTNSSHFGTLKIFLLMLYKIFAIAHTLLVYILEHEALRTQVNKANFLVHHLYYGVWCTI